jgi:hypothetical protein
MTPDDREYYLRRATEEDRAAEAAISLAARWRHEELAFLYRSRANGDGVSRSTVIANDFVPYGGIAL